MALCPGLPRWAGTRKVKPMWILLKQETVSGSGISCAICKSAPRSSQITTPAPHHSVFYRPDAVPATQPTASKHWRHWLLVHQSQIQACMPSALVTGWTITGVSGFQHPDYCQQWPPSALVCICEDPCRSTHTTASATEVFLLSVLVCGMPCRHTSDSIRHFKKSLTGQVQAVSWPWHCD